jgi:multidrug efflux system outer membrane protein
MYLARRSPRTREALIVYDRAVLRALQETDNAFKAYGAANSTLRRRLGSLLRG